MTVHINKKHLVPNNKTWSNDSKAGQPMSSFFTDYQFEHGLYNSSIGVDVNCNIHKNITSLTITRIRNNSHLCSCLYIILYIGTMLATSNAKFHIRLLPSRWYCTNVLEPFLVADKYTKSKHPKIFWFHIYVKKEWIFVKRI